MASRRPSRKHLRALCAEVHAEDGVDPRELARQSRAAQPGRRKAWQLCSQVARTLSDVLAGRCDDEILCSLDVLSVEPAPDTARLLVTVSWAGGSKQFDPALVLERLRHASGMLRCEMAASITRRKAPVLVYRVVEPPTGAGSTL